MTTPNRSILKQKLTQENILVAPGIYDLISVKLADQMNFDCLYMTGFGTVAAYLGEPDAGLATYTNMQNRVTAFCGASQTPIICDGDTGYGGLLNVAHTVRGYEAAGAAGIQLEDQESPKKCGHTPGRRVIPIEDMVKKIQVAKEVRTDPNFLIVARTDARTSLGLDEALRRGEKYYQAGADVIFIESPESEQELERIGKTIEAPLLVNIVEGGKTPQLLPEDLQKLGFSIVIYPLTGLLAITQTLENVYQEIKALKGTLGLVEQIYPFQKMCHLMNFEAVWEFEKKHP
jgi:2-methylisocitrate lyase-like PEP mutase family enzyme